MRWYHWLVLAYVAGSAISTALVVLYWPRHWRRWMRKLSFQDGDPLPGGKVVSLANGSLRAAYRCGCGREQAAECTGFDATGISEKLAQQFGWNYADGGWMCPFCSGEPEKLRQVFK